ncbi:hypothetical protein ACN2MM_09565 [Alkalilimnicola ehrlichii MLHE-1]|uniref:Uncharacterized protein n=1 Tax=Alkalilimnicola ehrlichii (strain ATCC BAA-1101 / DSM 17681 / MLHE-1) TaxID=187272 RepID=Q0A7S6_ALKEH|nr:hypothetical protein [Alkalilimnicola ehrlichii]ABI57111.1 conserved hypothetical protein [Alkalilimnicola ehrlichii MLHE-1]
MHIRKGMLVLWVLALLVAAPAHALDGATVDRWLNALQALDEWAEEEADDLERELRAMDDPGDMAPGEFGRVMAEAARQHAAVQELMQRHGFEDAQAWARTSNRIFNAFYALEMERMAPEMERERQQALRDLEESPHLTEEQKAQMREALEQQKQIMADAVPEVPEQDLQAVRAREESLRAFFER